MSNETDHAGHAYQLFYGDLNLCGCGNPETAYNLIAALLPLFPLHQEGRWRTAEDMIGSRGAAHIVLCQLQEAGLISHGSSVMGSWLTPKGEYYRRTLPGLGWERVDDDGFPEHDCDDECWQP